MNLSAERPLDSPKSNLGYIQKDDKTSTLVEVDAKTHRRHAHLGTRCATPGHYTIFTTGQTERRERGGTFADTCTACATPSEDMDVGGSEQADSLESLQKTAHSEADDVDAGAKLESLVSGTDIANGYRFDGGKSCQNVHWRCAISSRTSDRVLLKFRFGASAEWENSVHMHRMLHPNRHVCRLLDVIHKSKGELPPCSVYEAGDCTLVETLTRGPLKYHLQWSYIQKMLEAIEFLHRHGIVHGDMHPRNFVWFSLDSVWKLANLEHACRSDEEAPLHESCLKYAAPEIQRVFTEGKTTIQRTPAQDMYAFGIIVYEICTCSCVLDAHRLQKSIASRLDEILNNKGEASRTMRSAKQRKRCEDLKHEERYLRFVESLLRNDPNERQTSRQILDNDFLHPTTERDPRIDLSESSTDDRHSREEMQWTALPWSLILKMGITMKPQVECFLRSSNASEPFYQRRAQEALRFYDEFLPDHPVHILRLEQDARLRLHISVDRNLHFTAERVLAFRVKPTDEDFVDLDVVAHRQDEGIEAVALLTPSKFTSNQFHVISPYFGLVDRKYVKLMVHVKVQLNGPFRREIDLYQRIYCKIVHPRARLWLHRWLRMFENQDQHDINA